MTAEQPRRRLSPAQRRAALLAAATEAFSAAGYDEVQVTDVAAAADASPALVFHYFGSKAGLHAHTVEAVLDELTDRWSAATAEPAPSARERVRVLLEESLGVAARTRLLIAAGDEPAATTAVRAAARKRQVQLLRDNLVLTSGWDRHTVAVPAWLGFVDAAVGDWIAHGRPEQLRAPLLTACLGALEGALGDWAG